MTKYYTAMYRGKLSTGVDPDWYPIKNKLYVVEVRRGLFGRYYVTRVHGYEHKPHAESTIKYKNREDFLCDWDSFKEEELA